MLVLVAAAVAVGAAVATQLGSGAGPGSAIQLQAEGTFTGPVGPEGVPLEEGSLLAPVTTSATGQPVDGVGCDASGQITYHVHTHLAVYVGGVLRPVPAGVGIVEPVTQQTPDGPFDEATTCTYWLHVHAQDGIIHVESPTAGTYTLGQFFAIWRQPLSATRVGPARGPVTAFVDGHRFGGNPATIHLGSREDVQLDVGTPVVSPKQVDWARTRL